ncbi:MAG: redox-sensing transcriptional repressor Rex [Clostridia bacterium]|nr:redox-sensing transcriptional repressor Rex [Clostridia bacterium]
MNNNGNKVPEVVIKRLPRYYRYLGELLNQGIGRISSNALSEKMKVTASQIRHDFNYFGGFGQQGYGYNVEYLYNEIGTILGLKESYQTIIVGAGNLGQALATHQGFEKRGFFLKGIFDNSEDKIGKQVNGHTVLSTDELESFISENNIEIAILTVPRAAVLETAERLADCGIKGLLNFSSIELKLKKPIPVESVHLSDSLMVLGYEIKQGGL